MMRKLILALIFITAVALFITVQTAPTPTAAYQTDVFFDDFDGTELDTDKWLVAFKQWGGANANGGVRPENVSVSNGKLIIEAHGNNYTGDLMGINKDLSERADGKRVGGAIATKDYFASGDYEIRMKVVPQYGVASAIWTFQYAEYYPGDPEYLEKPVGGVDYYAVNHEIDIEMPGRPAAAHTGFDFNRVLFNTWTGENNDEYTVNYTDVGAPQDDGEWHTYQFKWHTGDDNETQRVEFYIDGVLKNTTTTDVPTNAGRLWIGAWFPNGWTGTPNFDTDYLEIDWVKITPYAEDGDRWHPETFPNEGWGNMNYNVASDIFYDDFSADTLDPGKWLIAHKNWGGQLGASTSWNGGVRPQNVKLEDGKLILEAHGNRYNGPLMGINKDGSLRTDGKRVGAAIATSNYYGSGRYEINMKLAPELGVVSAIWTFHYQEFYPADPEFICKPVGCENNDGYYAINHEIDMEFPGRPADAHENMSFNYGLFNTWTGENLDEYTVNYENLGQPLDDGQFHTYRFDWHTGDTGETPRVEFYIDNVLINTTTTDIPTNSSRLWIAAWFARNWAGNANFDTSQIEIDWVKITPFNEAGDVSVAESFPQDGWAEYWEYPNAETSGTPPTATPVPGATNTPVPPTATAVPPTVTPSANNLVTNPGFESGLSGWTCSGTAVAESNNPYSGSNNLKLTPSQSTIARCKKTITVQANTTYDLSAYIKTSGIYAYVGVNGHGEVGSNPASYSQYTKTFTTGASETSVTIYLQAWKQQVGSAYLDDVSLTEQ